MSSHGNEAVRGGRSEAQLVGLSSQLLLSFRLLIRRLLNLLLEQRVFFVEVLV